MSKTKQTETTDASASASAEALGMVTGLAGAAAFADAERREILNLLGEQDSAGSCCGGSCCA